MKRLIIRSEIKSVIIIIIIKCPCKQNSEPDGFLRELYQIYKEKLKSILLQLFQKIEEEATFINLFCKATVILIPNQTNYEKRMLLANIVHEYRSKNLNKIGSYPVIKLDSFQSHICNQAIYANQSKKRQNHTIILYTQKMLLVKFNIHS